MKLVKNLFILFAVFVFTDLSAQQEKQLKLTFTNSTTKQTVVLKRGSYLIIVYKDCNGQIKKVEDNIFNITEDGIELAMTSSGGRKKIGLVAQMDKETKLFAGDTKILYQEILEFKKVPKIKPILSALIPAAVGIAGYFIIRNQYANPSSDESELVSILASMILPPITTIAINKIMGESNREKMSDGWTYRVE